jgi:hypothetical protein
MRVYVVVRVHMGNVCTILGIYMNKSDALKEVESERDRDVSIQEWNVQ